MRRRLIYGIALVVLAAACGAWLWLNSPSGVMPASDFSGTQDPLSEWSRFASQIPLPQETILDSAEEVVALMNHHSPQAFSGRKIRFVLWQPGDAPVPGYQLNPNPAAREEFDKSVNSMRHSPRFWRGAPLNLEFAWIPGLVEPEANPTGANEPARRNTLEEQTTSYLSYHQYRTCLSGDEMFIFRQDAFLPRLVTRKLYVLSDGMMRWLLDRGAAYTVLPDGRWDIRPFLERQDIRFEPGASAYYDPRDEAATLTLDEDNLELACMMNFSGGCTGGDEAVNSKSERWRVKWWYWRAEQMGMLRERLGLAPPTP